MLYQQLFYFYCDDPTNQNYKNLGTLTCYKYRLVALNAALYLLFFKKICSGFYNREKNPNETTVLKLEFLI